MTELRPGTPVEAGLDPERVALIRERGAEWVEADHSSALVLLVARRGVVCLHEGWGVPADASFLLASLCKPVAAAVALMLVEEGKLSLTRPVVHYLPELSGAGAEEILVQQLLTHTSGFALDEAAALAYAAAHEAEAPACPPGQDSAMHRYLHALYGRDTDRPAGEAMAYSSFNFELLGEIIRRVAAQPLPEFFRERIFAPLGMDDTRLGFDPAFEERLVLDFDRELLAGLPVGDELRAYLSMPNVAVSLFGPASDYARFVQMLANGGRYGDSRLLSPASVAQMARNQIPTTPAVFGDAELAGNSGLGLLVFTSERWPWWHGSLPPVGCVGMSGLGGTCFWIDPAHELIALYFSWCGDIDPETREHHWDADLFQNMVTAAVADGR